MMIQDEIERVLASNLPRGLKRKVVALFEWNNKSRTEAKTARQASIEDFKEVYENDKVLKRSSVIKNLIAIKQENQAFIDEVNSVEGDDRALNELRIVFNAYSCFSCRHLHKRFVAEFLLGLINGISALDKRTQVRNKFQSLLNTIAKHQVRSSETAMSGSKKFIIKKDTLDFFRVSNKILVELLDKVGYSYEVLVKGDGTLVVTFETGQRNLGMLEVIFVDVFEQQKLPLRYLGQFVK